MCEVMLYHCVSPEDAVAVNSSDLWLSNFFTGLVMGPISSLCMCWFFTITGFLLFRNLSFQTLGKKLKSRVRTLLVPYLLWQVLFIVKSILQGNSWTFGEMFAQTFLLRLWPPLGVFWYVYTVFLFALLSPIFLVLFHNKKSAWLSVIILIILLYIYWDKLYIGNGKYHYTGNIKSFFPAYLIGAFYGHIYDNSTVRQKLKYAVCFLLVATVLDSAVKKLLYNMTLSILPILMLFLIPVPEWSKNRKLYRLNFLIYATHPSIISLSINHIRAIVLAVIPYASAANILGCILCILLIIAVNAVIHAIMNRFAPRTLGILTGGRC